jgi:hypothetical protein
MKQVTYSPLFLKISQDYQEFGTISCENQNLASRKIAGQLKIPSWKGELTDISKKCMFQCIIRGMALLKYTQQVHKFFVKIVFRLAVKGRWGFFRSSEDFTYGALCPLTLTLPLGGGREGWG